MEILIDQWRAVDHEDKLLEAFVSEHRDRKAAQLFILLTAPQDNSIICQCDNISMQNKLTLIDD